MTESVSTHGLGPDGGVDYSPRHQEIRRVALITSPVSGSGRAALVAEQARQELKERGLEIVEATGATPEDSRQRLRGVLLGTDPRQTLPVDAVVACGGDGLIATALQEQVGTGIPMGIIPAGTGNDFARAAGIPMDFSDAVDVVMAGRATPVDLGVLRPASGEEIYFDTVAYGGFDSVVTDPKEKLRWPPGGARYVVAALRELFSLHGFEATLELDGQEVCRGRISMCAVGNTSSYGGGIHICPKADCQDGVFNISLVHQYPRAKMIHIFWRILRGGIEEVPGAKTFTATRGRLDIPGVLLYSDGDPRFSTPVEFEIAPGAGLFLLPRP